MRRILPVVVLIAACTTEPPDSSGDGVVRPVVTTEPLQLQEELRLGEAEEFYSVTGLAQGQDGALYVLESDGVRVYNQEGTLQRRFGRKGDGPGEFRAAQTIQVVQDTLVVGDLYDRLHFFTTSGDLLRTHVYHDLFADSWMSYFTTRVPGGWLLQANRASEMSVGQFSGWWVGEGGALTPSGFEMTATIEGEEVSIPGGMAYLTAPYEMAPRWAVSGLGRILFARSRDYVLEVFGTDGSALGRIEVDVPGVRVDAGLKAKWLEWACRNQTECVNERAAELPGPEFVPPVGDLWAYPSGHFAVRREDLRSDLGTPFPGGPWDVFDPDGTFLGTLPEGMLPRWFDGETLLTIERDDLRVEYVARYQVVP